ncbi:glycogen/starch/alpha-glucan phosphorylase [Desulfobacterales bacterium HSG17]|nr:glycogen/starch/alpha-glucan phosphorylase [Desulfobacterales bacterium HSG17]
MSDNKFENSTRYAKNLKQAILRHVRYSLGKNEENLSGRDIFTALALTIRDLMTDRMLETEVRYKKADVKQVYYLSMEFLIGRSLESNLHSLGILDSSRKALAEIGFDLETVIEKEDDAALGNGGLGRLAACFIDSLATLGMPGFGYGINYEFGLFKQKIHNGYQKEMPDNWLGHGTPWEIAHPDEICFIPVYGRIEHGKDREGNYNPMWMEWKLLTGIPYDMPIAGYGGKTINYLRLYSAKASHEFDMDIFNTGDYIMAVEQKIASETISKVLYPSDSGERGRELRLLQEYFLVACAIRDIVRRYQMNHKNFDNFSNKVAIQMNDTHPALAVVELMRIFVDEKEIPWDTAWDITRSTLAYTNHTLMSEALEKWPVSLFERVIPRHLQIIYEINHRFLDEVASAWPGDFEHLQKMSIIEEGNGKYIRMAHLAIIGSHSVNGVSAIHTELIKNSLVPEFYHFSPEKFNNKTNGVTHRRWLLSANPLLADLINTKIGQAWITDLERLRELEAYADDKEFQKDFMDIKLANRKRLAKIIKKTNSISINPDSLFDVHAKRIHEYKRQLLFVMYIIHEYLCLIEDGQEPVVPRTFIFAGKAASGYWKAKQIIKLIHNVGNVINNDPRVGGLIRIVFIPDYRVSLAEKIIPAADLSEQISMAGTEASGTGNMKFAMNGALTIGTMDGANIEIMEEVGKENIFLFGLRASEIRKMSEKGIYNPKAYYENPSIRRILDTFKSDIFCSKEPGLFRWIYELILNEGDQYFHLADISSYIEIQRKAAALFNNQEYWAKKAILNTARTGKFSSDRTIAEYAKDIWGIQTS